MNVSREYVESVEASSTRAIVAILAEEVPPYPATIAIECMEASKALGSAASATVRQVGVLAAAVVQLREQVARLTELLEVRP